MQHMPFDLVDLDLIVRIVAEGSLTAASRELGFTPAAASRRLAAVEEQLGVTLFSRTAQRLQLTTRGREFLEYAKRVLAAANDAAHAMRTAELDNGREGLSGLFRLTAPVTFGRKVIMPILSDFLAAHSGLRLDLLLTDTVHDLAEASCDAAVRLAPLMFSQQFKVQQIGEHRQVLCAAPDYIARYGMPSGAADLARHNGLLLAGVDGWVLRVPGGEACLVRPRARVTSNSTDVLYEACLAGLGIGAHAMWEVADRLADGSLVVLPASIGEPNTVGVWLVLRETAAASDVPARVLAFTMTLGRHLQSLSSTSGPVLAEDTGTNRTRQRAGKP